MKKLIFSIAIIATCITACKKKSDDPAPTPPTSTTPNTGGSTTPTQKETFLTQNTWHFTASTADKPIVYLGSSTASTDVYSQMGICASDVDYTYSTNKKGTYSGDCGGTASAASYPFTWALTSNETVLTITAFGEVNNWTILQLDATTLKVTYEDTDDNGLSYMATDTYSKK